MLRCASASRGGTSLGHGRVAGCVKVRAARLRRAVHFPPTRCPTQRAGRGMAGRGMVGQPPELCTCGSHRDAPRLAWVRLCRSVRDAPRPTDNLPPHVRVTLRDKPPLPVVSWVCLLAGTSLTTMAWKGALHAVCVACARAVCALCPPRAQRAAGMPNRVRSQRPCSAI